MLTNKRVIKLLSAAAIICCIAPGISYAQNNIIEDSKLTLETKAKLASEQGLPAEKIHVKTQDGIAYLSGTVASEQQASAAIETAISVKGIKDVNASDLKVLGSNQPLTDTYITAKVKGLYIREKLFGDKPMAIKGITVESKNGVVYLGGKVANRNLEQNAISLARQVVGVKDVVSVIKFK